LRDQDKVLNTVWQVNFIGAAQPEAHAPLCLASAKAKPPETTRTFFFLKKREQNTIKIAILAFFSECEINA